MNEGPPPPPPPPPPGPPPLPPALPPEQPKSKESGWIEVKTGFFPLAFLFFFCTPQIDIDGKMQKRRWGTHRFKVPVGRHRVTIWFAYLFMSRCGENSVEVDVGASTVRRVHFNMPPLIFMPGTIRVR